MSRELGDSEGPCEQGDDSARLPAWEGCLDGYFRARAGAWDMVGDAEMGRACVDIDGRAGRGWRGWSGVGWGSREGFRQGCGTCLMSSEQCPSCVLGGWSVAAGPEA